MKFEMYNNIFFTNEQFFIQKNIKKCKWQKSEQFIHFTIINSAKSILKYIRQKKPKNKKNEPTKQNIISITVLLSIGRAVFLLTLKC